MTNITLSIEDSVYKQMRSHSEIRWSEFVRQCIQRRVKELELIEKHPHSETILTMLASEDVLKKDWENAADERWNNV